MGDSFSKKLGDLLSDVLETGEVPKAQEFSANGDTSASRNFSTSGDVSASAESSASDSTSASAESSTSGDASASAEYSAGGGESVGGDFSASKHRPKFNFSQKKTRVAQVIRQGSYTEIPQEVVAAFALLGCPVTSTPAEVRRTFRSKIKKLHPDSASQNSENATAESEKLISANETIKNWFIQKGI